MSGRVPADRHGDLLDWLYERGKQRARRVPEFDVERTISRAYAARDAGAVNFWSVLSPAERSAFESAARKQVFAPGTALMREGEQADAGDEHSPPAEDVAGPAPEQQQAA